MKRVFADIFYYLAFLNEHDAAHKLAVDFLASFSGTILTTDWVLAELANSLSNVNSRRWAIEFIEAQLSDPAVVIILASRQLLMRGWELYSRRPDKEWSLTDCISFPVMTRLRVREALTGDHHFEQAGFIPLLK